MSVSVRTPLRAPAPCRFSRSPGPCVNFRPDACVWPLALLSCAPAPCRCWRSSGTPRWPHLSLCSSTRAGTQATCPSRATIGLRCQTCVLEVGGTLASARTQPLTRGSMHACTYTHTSTHEHALPELRCWQLVYFPHSLCTPHTAHEYSLLPVGVGPSILAPSSSPAAQLP